MNLLKKISSLCVVLLTVVGCGPLDIAPVDRFTELNFWTSGENVNNALNNIYSGMYNSTLYFYNEALSDNAYTAQGSAAGNPEAIASGSFTSTLPKFQNDWSFYYSGIKSCNIFLTNVDQNTTLPAETLARMKGEVRFVRAWHHFNLMKWYGDVPLLDRNISPDEAKTIARSPRATVLKFVTDELTAAAAVLPSRDAYAPADNGRITKGAAIALQARALLYEGNRMAEVVTLCEQLMNDQTTNGQYGLAANYGDLFSSPTVNKTSNESILALQYVPGLRTWSEFFDFAPRSVGARTNSLAPTQELVNDYIMLNGKAISETGSGYVESNPYVNRDPRLTATVVYDQYLWRNADGTTQTIYIRPGSDPVRPALNEYALNGQGSPTGYYWRKYYDPNSLANFASGLNLHLIRYAEVLLMYAEAKQSLGQMTADVWDKTIRPLRQRAGFTDAAALNFPTGGDLTQIIRRERRTEFAMEGLRIDDIRRWRIAETVLNGYAHGAKFGDPAVDNGYIRAQRRQFDPAKNYLWPLPASELNLNTSLTQNPGY
ncbi:RagB/SusD family nutrient uptake outer membrane protein [Spirosoma sp. RP8]|uniref:RagB/SusD family nutrient uptake outer membrane protein n=1 Tax=Spirosoma liriopis TaxID=2937440 RepID=A0ABT0HRE8_9BACT|nr:RagB/SusD family nutrient uptake outer membrane protein [Spirosoma liriopis]MCK8494751.1 RagB/SusD family nutrient uptake outer membrane protein [Spirosoma liriopis]